MQGKAKFLIAVNSGYYNTKIKTADLEDVYFTRTQERTGIGNGRTLIIGDKEYEIGDGVKNISNEKHNSLTHKLCTLYAIAKYCPDGADVHLVTSLPVNQYLDSLYKELYKYSFLANPKYSVIVDGEIKSFVITDVTIYMEGASAILPYASEFKNRTIGVIDIGGYTINCAVFENQKLLIKTSFSLDKGMYHLERNICDALGREGYGYIKEYEVNSLYNSTDSIVKNIVDIEVTRLIRELKEQLTEKGWNLKTLNLFGTGGGWLKLNSFLSSEFHFITLPNCALYDNVRGLYKVGEISEKVHKYN